MKAIILGIFIAVVMIGIAAGAYVRVSPVIPTEWHVDPETAEDPGMRGVRVAMRVRAEPEEAMKMLDEIIMADPNSEYLAGSIEELHISYVSRTELARFPDVTSIKAIPEEGATRIMFLGRARFGQDDFGKNRRRIFGWISEMQERTE